MNVYCMRHAQAESAAEDATRQLSDDGQLEVTSMGAFLQNSGLQIEHIIHSCKTRTEQTAQGIAPYVQCEHVMPCAAGINEADDAADMLPVIAAWESDTLIVSHLPFISNLVAAMVSGDTNNTMLNYPPCTIVCLNKVSDTQWVFDWMITPQIIRHVPA